ncbi:putative protein TPRXL [Leptopilina heterotoma]|uniref:putative protein TPRXL n=1 Tax=Leptopilina heterotoma TaxID=63436 RepID=UPI001CA882DE|nr:putative protein TPRXL [Leptopilina heterotoma]
MWRCDCIKRNGLQDSCMLVDCLGRPECMTKLFPICGPGKKALLKLTDLGDAEVALKKFYSADRARESALAAYCRLKCSNPGPTNNCPQSSNCSSQNSQPNCPSLNSPPNCPSLNSPPNCPSSNPAARNFAPNFPTSNCPFANSSPPNWPLSNSPSPNFPSAGSPYSNCPSFNPPAPKCPSSNCPSFNSPPRNYPPASYSQSNNCPPPYNNSSSSNYRVASWPPPNSSFQPLAPRLQMQSCPQQQSQNQNFFASPPPCATCMSH